MVAFGSHGTYLTRERVSERAFKPERQAISSRGSTGRYGIFRADRVRWGPATGKKLPWCSDSNVLEGVQYGIWGLERVAEDVYEW